MVGGLHVSHVGLPPLDMVLLSGHRFRVVREFCFVKCDFGWFDVFVKVWLWMGVRRRGLDSRLRGNDVGGAGMAGEVAGMRGWAWE